MLPFTRLLSGLPLFLLAAAQAQQSASAALITSGLPSPDGAVERGLSPYLHSRSARFVDWLADGSMLVITRFGESAQVHLVRAPLSMREQRSYEPSGVIAAAAEPEHSDSFVLLTPCAGRGTALLLQRPGQPPMPLTDGTFRDGAALWAHHGTRLAFSSNRAAAPDREVEVLDTTAPGSGPRTVAAGAGYRWRAFDWSLDDQRLLLGRESVAAATDAADGVAEPELFVVGADGGELTPLVLPRKHEGRGPPPAPQPLQAATARFAPDGRGLLLLTAGDAAGAQADGFRELRYLDPVTGESHELSSAGGHDVELFDESADGHYLAYSINDEGTSRLMIIDQLRKLDLNPVALPPGVITSLKFDSAGKRLALTFESANAPRDVYVLEPETQTLTRWTASESGPLDPRAFSAPALLHFPTWDKVNGEPRMLSAYAYRPGAAPPTAAKAAHGDPAPTGPRPVLILLRSGGGDQFRPGYLPLVQYLVNGLGFVVVAPEVRGASGFGRAFGTLAQGERRDDAARDVGSLLVWIGLQHELDHDRVMIMGEGYGSYLALACLAQYGDRLRGAIAAFPPHLGSATSFMAIRRPVLLVHGRSDPDVPAYETEQLAARLRAGGSAVQYLGATNEAGEFLRQSDRDAYFSAVANFLAPLLR
ncbi:MAG TPA: prolyl oligopeptidase family serine peptidase [Steroidobacteraceae bacterium]